MATDVAQGTTITWTDGFTALVTDIQLSGAIARTDVETTNLATTVAKTFVPGDMYEPGELVTTIFFDPADTIPVTATANVIRIAWGGDTSNEWTQSGFVQSVDLGGGMEDMMAATITWKLSGSLGQNQ